MLAYIDAPTTCKYEAKCEILYTGGAPMIEHRPTTPTCACVCCRQAVKYLFGKNPYLYAVIFQSPYRYIYVSVYGSMHAVPCGAEFAKP